VEWDSNCDQELLTCHVFILWPGFAVTAISGDTLGQCEQAQETKNTRHHSDTGVSFIEFFRGSSFFRFGFAFFTPSFPLFFLLSCSAKYVDCHSDYSGQGVDQLAQIIHTLKTNPDDRRILMSAWNPTDMKLMALPPW
jgi:hypothetical protein